MLSPPTRFAGPLTRPDPSVATRHLPTQWGVTLPEGAKGAVPVSKMLHYPN